MSGWQETERKLQKTIWNWKHFFCHYFFLYENERKTPYMTLTTVLGKMLTIQNILLSSPYNFLVTTCIATIFWLIHLITPVLHLVYTFVRQACVFVYLFRWTRYPAAGEDRRGWLTGIIARDLFAWWTGSVEDITPDILHLRYEAYEWKWLNMRLTLQSRIWMKKRVHDWRDNILWYCGRWFSKIEFLYW